ncbi:electron transport complex subunit RsxC [Ruminococcaceae bacterium OttesenSCG-928-D13]|nr:electron transport complex subunit RsxC [Ruminococcaceae bacterium OttesenSCG-928-D13]
MGKFLRSWGRGCSVPHRKGTSGLATVTMPLPPKLKLLMQQHIGAPCVPAVAKGDTVLVGSVVGKAQGFVGADIHSGVSGTVTAIEPVQMPSGAVCDAVVIEPDGQQTIDPSIAPPAVRDRETFLAAVRACGLVGLGGAGFPTSVKLSPKNLDKIDSLIINAAECEPYITVDEREMLENGDNVISGVMAVKKYLNIPHVYIAIERNKPEATDLMFSLTKGDSDLSVVPLPTNYPQGAEKVLIQTVTGREVPSDGLPADIGVLVLNVTTVSTIGQYLASGMPLMSRRLTIAGGAVAEPKNVEVMIGTPIEEIIEFCGGFKSDPAKLLMGGPMMGVAMTDVGYPTLKQNNAILALTLNEIDLHEPDPCIRCGRCIMHCPVQLSPTEIEEAYTNKDMAMMQKLHSEVCMGCGVCSFVCPAKRLLSPATTLARLAVLAEARKAAAAKAAEKAPAATAKEAK